MKGIQFVAGILILIVVEVLKVYFIMPFPGSQEANTIDTAYFLHTNIWFIRVIGYLIILYPVIYFLRFGVLRAKILVSVSLIGYAVVFYMFNFQFLADKMFYQPEMKVFASVAESKIDTSRLVIGVELNGESKAYPIQFIGYHHQVRDSIGGKPVMITYCTVCRTGRVFSPFVDGKLENFRLVGMDHFNAMFEDETTGSWWRQVTGDAIAGDLKGKSLEEVPSEQMTLNSWIVSHPNTLVMQPDTTFNGTYEKMSGYEKGKGGDLTGRDSLSWEKKSWVVGVVIGSSARAYDWNDLVTKRVLNDTLAHTPIAVMIQKDSASFHVFKRDLMEFAYDSTRDVVVDKGTQSVWDWNGVCVEGALAGQRVSKIRAYQEFWHSWNTSIPGLPLINLPINLFFFVD